MYTDLKTGTVVNQRSNNVPSQTSNSVNTDWRLWCRLCAKDDPHSNISVFFKDEEQNGSNLDPTACNPNEGADFSLAVAIEKYFWVQIKRNEELPKMLCTECFSLITSLVNFSDRVTKVQQMFSVLHNAYQATSPGIDFREIRLKYGLLDEDREHVLIQQQLPEVHYFESKPKINELEERIYSNESLMPVLATNPLEDLPRIRIKIKKESIVSEEHLEEHFGNDVKDFYGEYEASEECEDITNNETSQNVICHDIEDKSLSLRTRKHSQRNSINAVPHVEPDVQKRRKSQRRKNKLSRNYIFQETKNTETSSVKDVTVSEPPETLLNNEDEDDEIEEKEEKEVTYMCTECPRKFKRSQHLRQHLRRSHAKLIKSPMLQCTHCSKTFATSKQLDFHSKMHLPPEQRKILPCPYCEKKFSSHTLVQTHIKYIHMNERPFICEECGIAVRTNAALKTHMLTHTDYAPFECEVCKKGFKNQIRLKNHMETHDPNKHICAECGLQLNSRATLNRHLLVHSDEMQHKCDYCGRAFKRAKALKNHLILHTGLKPYSCDFCDRTFANGSNCRSHKKKAHPEELAALEAAGGGKTYTRNIPKLEALKAVTKAADNLAPVVSKQSGRFAFGKKPRLSTQEEAPIPDQPAKARTDNHKRYSSSPTSGLLVTSTTNEGDIAKSAALHAISLNSTLTNRAQTPPTVPVAMPNINNIYNHIMKQATIAVHSASVGDHHEYTMQIKRPASQTSCATMENDNGSPNVTNMHQHQLQHTSMQQATPSATSLPPNLYSQLMKQSMLQREQQEQQQSQSLQHLHHHQLNHHQHQYQLHQHQHHLHADDVAPSIRSPDSQTSSSHVTEDQSNTADPTHFYNNIRQNHQSPYI